MSSLMLVDGFVSACIIGWFESSGGADNFSFSYYVPFLCLFRLRKNW